MGDSQRVPWHRVRGHADVILRGGTFSRLVTLETPEAPPTLPQRFLGIAVGIATIVTNSDGHSDTGEPIARVRQRCATHRQPYQAPAPGVPSAACRRGQACPLPSRRLPRPRPPHRGVGQRHGGCTGARSLDPPWQPDDGAARPVQQADHLVWSPTAGVEQLQSTTSGRAGAVRGPAPHQPWLRALWLCGHTQPP